ncbi:MAG: tRNA pseudouridine(55) synthase TruB, partial [Nannocystaceae bacterium]
RRGVAFGRTVRRRRAQRRRVTDWNDLSARGGRVGHDLVGWVRWALGVRQVGHCGTLDPLASGLMILCVGSATRLVPYLTALDKTYRAAVALGRSTESADREGATVATAAVTAEQVAAAPNCVREMVGDFMLPPPVYSAIKVDGQRAHRRVRRGDAVALDPRPMTVFSATNVISSDDEEPLIHWSCRVSKGTYVRSLAEELGRRVGVPAHLAGLRRLACGRLEIADPGVVSPIETVELPPIEGRPRKFRCVLPGCSGDRAREQTGEQLHKHLIDPVACLPLPAYAREPGDLLLTRLSHGQACGPEHLEGFTDTLGQAELLREGPGANRIILHGVEDCRRITIVARVHDGRRALATEKVVREASPQAKPPKRA